MRRKSFPDSCISCTLLPRGRAQSLNGFVNDFLVKVVKSRDKSSHSGSAGCIKYNSAMYNVRFLGLLSDCRMQRRYTANEVNYVGARITDILSQFLALHHTYITSSYRP